MERRDYVFVRLQRVGERGNVVTRLKFFSSTNAWTSGWTRVRTLAPTATLTLAPATCIGGACTRSSPHASLLPAPLHAYCAAPLYARCPSS